MIELWFYTFTLFPCQIWLKYTLEFLSFLYIWFKISKNIYVYKKLAQKLDCSHLMPIVNCTVNNGLIWLYNQAEAIKNYFQKLWLKNMATKLAIKNINKQEGVMTSSYSQDKISYNNVMFQLIAKRWRILLLLWISDHWGILKDPWNKY
jgi:hypothetical protein